MWRICKGWVQKMMFTFVVKITKMFLRQNRKHTAHIVVVSTRMCLLCSRDVDVTPHTRHTGRKPLNVLLVYPASKHWFWGKKFVKSQITLRGFSCEYSVCQINDNDALSVANTSGFYTQLRKYSQHKKFYCWVKRIFSIL